jgi:hypothetical protein
VALADLEPFGSVTALRADPLRRLTEIYMAVSGLHVLAARVQIALKIRTQFAIVLFTFPVI